MDEIADTAERPLAVHGTDKALDVVFIEVLDKHDGVVSRHRFEGLPITLGSAYRNDFIIDDESSAVGAPVALIIDRDAQGALCISAAETSATFWAPGGLTRRWLIDPEQAVSVAGQRLRVRTSAYVPTGVSKRAAALPRAAQLAWLWALPLAMATFVATTWVNDIDGTKAVIYVTSGLGIVMALMLWAGIWALVSRLTGRSTHFVTHLALGALTFVAVNLVDYVLDSASFAFNLPVIQRYDYLLLGVIVGVAVWCHGRWVSRVRVGTALTTALIVGGAILASQAAGFYTLRGNIAASQTLVEIRPPSWKVASGVGLDQFFSDAAALKEAAEKSKPEKPDGLDFSSYDAD